MKTIENQIVELCHGAVDVIPKAELEKKLKTKKKLKIKLGADPTSPDLHLGHAIVLKKLKQFQDLGHEVIFLIGDFTTLIGDPSGRSKTRPALTQEEITKNMHTYFDQVGKILDTDRVKIMYNSQWLKPLDAEKILKILAKVTAARVLEREDFAKRLQEGQPIGFHELLYPIFQGYDSVALQADVELGGTDQTFNLLMGRFLQEQYGQEPQVIITMPLLVGLDGVQKMSKSLGNAISLAESADQVYGKLMSISDDLMWRYATLLLDYTDEKIASMQARIAYGTLHPMACKKDIAHEIIRQFWSEKEADAARDQFEALFQKKDYSKAQEVTLPIDIPNPIWVVDLLKALDAVSTTSQAKRLIESGAVHINEEIMQDFKKEIMYTSGMIIKVGKHRIYKIA